MFGIRPLVSLVSESFHIVISDVLSFDRKLLSVIVKNIEPNKVSTDFLNQAG